MPKFKQLSIKEYADSIGLTRQAILHRINNGLHLPGVKSFTKVGKAYILTVMVEKSLLKMIKETCKEENGVYKVNKQHLHKLIKKVGLKPTTTEEELIFHTRNTD